MSAPLDRERARLLDKDGAAQYLAVSLSTINRLIFSGELGVVRLPAERAAHGHGRVGACRRVLIDIRDLDALIARSKERHGAQDHTTPLSLPTLRKASR